MFGAVRVGLMFGLAALVATLASLLLGGLPAGPLIALAAVSLLGWGAGYTAAKTTRAYARQRIGRGAVAGIVGGTLAMAGSVVAGVAFAALLRQGIDVWIERLAFIVRLDVDPAPYLRGGGLLAGMCLGVVNFMLMVAVGALGCLSWRR